MQVDVLSPLLFNILLDFVWRRIDKIECGIEWNDAKRLRKLDYADDICLLSSYVDEMQRMVDTLVREGNKIGLTINTARTELMKIRTEGPRSVSMENSNLKEVNSFVYLDFRLCSDGDKKSETNILTGKASYTFNCFSKVWREDRLSIATKLKLFNAIVASVLLYDCDSWKGLQEIVERVRRFESN